MKSFIHNIKDKRNEFPKLSEQPINFEPRGNKEKRIAFLNKYSFIFHGVLALLIVFIVEWISRHSITGAFGFVINHTKAYLYNSFIVYASLTIAYLVRRRALVRIFVSAFYIVLGIINGCILAKRVTPFGYTDLNCVEDLLSMENSNYFTASEAMLIVVGVIIFVLFAVLFFLKGPKFKGKMHHVRNLVLVTVMMLFIPLVTKGSQKLNIIESYFSNIAKGYENNGFIYGFGTSVFGRGMTRPAGYSKETVNNILDNVSVAETDNEEDPNIIVVLLESFIDPTEISFLDLSEDPIPNFHSLEDNYSTGYLTVPVFGAGTSNTEFEILTGMSMQYFGTGEYPHKTILKETNVESIASNLSTIGYGTHVVHNNGGNFYSRANAFSMMGFDTFTSKELMNIQEYTPLGNWATDNILVSETQKALNATEDQSDFVYTITVEAHGDYPTYQVIEDPSVTVTGAASQEANYQWEYYVNMLREVDNFIANLISMVEERDENTMIVFFGDHYPTLDVEDSDVESGSVYDTKYVTWNNFGLEKKDADVKAYELLATITDQLDIHEGTMFTYEQNALENGTTNKKSYSTNLEMLQYDLLYGSRYAYNGEDLYPATDLVMGIDDVIIDDVSYSEEEENKVVITGSSFTKWSKVYINDEKVSTKFISDTELTISKDSVSDGDSVVVSQVGSEETRFRSSNEVFADFSTE